MTSAMIEEQPGAAKRLLIRRFLVANGTQAEIDSGRFLQRFAMAGGALSQVASRVSKEITFRQSFELPMNALIKAYEKHRDTWQVEYEAHVNWEFSEEELSLIVGFLESSTGKHFLEGCSRMSAYVNTNTEHLVEQIIAEAEAALRGAAGPSAE